MREFVKRLEARYRERSRGLPLNELLARSLHHALGESVLRTDTSDLRGLIQQIQIPAAVLIDRSPHISSMPEIQQSSTHTPCGFLGPPRKYCNVRHEKSRSEDHESRALERRLTRCEMGLSP